MKKNIKLAVVLSFLSVSTLAAELGSEHHTKSKIGLKTLNSQLKELQGKLLDAQQDLSSELKEAKKLEQVHIEKQNKVHHLHAECSMFFFDNKIRKKNKKKVGCML